MIGVVKIIILLGDIGEEMYVDMWVRDELEEFEGGLEFGVKEKVK